MKAQIKNVSKRVENWSEKCKRMVDKPINAFCVTHKFETE